MSAKHMFIDKTSGNSRDSIQIRFAWFAHQSVDEYVGVRLALTGPNGPLWIPHPDPAVDLACIRLRLRPEDAGKANVPAVVPEAFIGPDELLQGADVLVLGCPSAAGALYWTEPVARKGIIGWVSPDDPLTQPILIDANTSPGNSGGPVFRLPGGMDRAGNLVLGGRVAFLGIVSKALPEYVPVTAADGRSNVKIPGLFAPSLVGLTVVESAQRVRETLEAAAKAAP